MTDKPILFSGPMIRALLDGRKTQTRRVLRPQPPEAPDSAWNPAPANIAKHTAPYLDAYCGERRTPQNPRGMSCNWHWWTVDDRPGPRVTKTQYAPGDRLWVREAYTLNPAVRHIERAKNVIYRADVPPIEPPLGNALTLDRMRWIEAQGLKWKPSIHMPRWASRMTLIVTDVRVQRVQEISEADAKAEGLEYDWLPPDEDFRGLDRWRGHDGLSWCAYADEAFAELWDSLNADRGFGWEANPWVSATTFTVHKCNIDQMEAA